MIAPYVNTQVTTISNTNETTIVTADPNFMNELYGLIITTTDAAAATLTLRESTGGTTRLVIDYPNASVAPGQPFIMMLDTPLRASKLKNQNWTLQASANAAHYTVTALFCEAS